jgi:hypothetical protein
MIRRISILCLAAAGLSAASGCRNNCGGWFTSSRGSAPCQLTGRSSDIILDSTGTPITGVPGGVPLIPGPPGADLPYPQPNGLIPPTGVPVPSAIPTPAPGDGGSAILPAPKFGVPVKK